MRKQGTATQLIVDGKPFLALAGELRNNSATSLEYMKPMWPKLVEAKLNTVLAGVSWAQIEPQEGKFDFSVLDGVIQGARSHNLHLVLLWFGSWKNGLSSYAPDWVKKDFERFPRAQATAGRSIERSQLLQRCEPGRRCPRLCRPDAARQGSGWPAAHRHHDPGGERNRHARRTPATARPLANKACEGQVPKELMDYLQQHKDTLIPELRQVWEAAGFKTSGTWEEVFGTGRRERMKSSWPGTMRATSAGWPRRAKPNTRCRCT